MRSTALFLKIFSLSVLIANISCSETEENETLESDKTEIAADIEGDDVNAEDYWDNATLVWSDEFDGSTVFEDKWDFVTRIGGVEDGSELQRYTGDDNIEISNGTLKITAKKEESGEYTSSRLAGNFSFKYGRMEVRAKMPEDKGNGIIARLWMLGGNSDTVGYPTCGEIDMLGYLSYIPNTMYAAYHTFENVSVNGGATTTGQLDFPSVEEDFHIYGVLVTDEYLKFYVDDIDNIIFTYERPANSSSLNWPFDQGFYFLMNVGVGGQYAGAEGVDDTIFPTEMEIDYVRVYHPQ